VSKFVMRDSGPAGLARGLVEEDRRGMRLETGVQKYLVLLIFEISCTSEGVDGGQQGRHAFFCISRC
jgi:hypothetical protein